MQPAVQDLAVDERGRFAVYGPASFVVVYDRSKHNFYELCEAIWAHWMRLQQEHPEMDPQQVFYWLDIFAMPPEDLKQPLSNYALKGNLEQVLQHHPELRAQLQRDPELCTQSGMPCTFASAYVLRNELFWHSSRWTWQRQHNL